MAEPKVHPMDLVDFRYVACPVLGREIRLKTRFTRISPSKYGPKKLIDCTGGLDCGAVSVHQGKTVTDFSSCPFGKVAFFS
ncbi:MAG: hypothetical protein AB1921_18475 [Thermodesulfobacteriota bacterium]